MEWDYIQEHIFVLVSNMKYQKFMRLLSTLNFLGVFYAD